MQNTCTKCRDYILENCADFLATICCRKKKSKELFISLIEEDPVCFEQVLSSPQVLQVILEFEGSSSIDPHLCTYIGIKKYLYKNEIRDNNIADYLAFMFIQMLFKTDWTKSETRSPEAYTTLMLQAIHSESWNGNDHSAIMLHEHLANYCLFITTIMHRVFTEFELELHNEDHYSMLCKSSFFTASLLEGELSPLFYSIAENTLAISKSLKEFSRSPFV